MGVALETQIKKMIGFDERPVEHSGLSREDTERMNRIYHKVMTFSSARTQEISSLEILKEADTKGETEVDRKSVV